MATYRWKVIEQDGKRLLLFDGFILSADLAKVKAKVGDIEKAPLNKWRKVTV